MKLLLVGSKRDTALESIYKKYLQLAGVEVLTLPVADMVEDFHSQNLINKLLFKTKVYTSYSKVNKALLETVNRFQPDVTWIFKGLEIYPETLVRLKSSTRIVNYNTDNPFIFSGSGSGNKNISDSIHLYDLHFTYNLEVKREIEKRFSMPVCWLPFGFDISKQVFEDCQKQEECLKVCFVGNPDKRRLALLKGLADAGILIDVYGHYWDKHLSHSNITILPPVYGAAFYSVIRKYRVQLNPLRIHNLKSHGMRSFEVPGIGGIMLAEETPEHQLFFEADKEAFFYKDISECVQKIRLLLSLTAPEADVIRVNARNRSQDSGYDYRSRTNYVISTLNESYATKRIAV